MSAGEMHHLIASGKATLRTTPPIGEAYDRAGLTNGWGGPYTAGLTREKIAQAMVVDVANVATYYFETAPKPLWTLDEDFRGVTPPFDLMWFEAPYPPRIYNFEHGRWDAAGRTIKRFGLLIERRDVSRDYLLRNPHRQRNFSIRMPRLGLTWREAERLGGGAFFDRTVREIDLGARWNVCAWGLTLLAHGNWVLGPWSHSNFYLDEKGDPITAFEHAYIDPGDNMVMTTASFLTTPDGMPTDLEAEFRRMQRSFQPLTDVAFLALSFMNCRNVALREVRPLKPLTDKQRRRGEQPRLAHHVIEITPMRPRAVGRVASGPVIALDRGKKSLHIVRGHFKHYGEQWGTKKLFGRISGKFWWDKHTAGDIGAGLVTTDYVVKP